MSTILAPTAEQLLDWNGVKEISSEVIDIWRHGNLNQDVYQRKSDGTYWQATYRTSTDGETNELREGGANIIQVEPYEKVTKAWRPVNIKVVQPD